MKLYNVAVAGATGLVGSTMIRVLEERKFPVNKFVAFASSRSVGKEVMYNGKPISVRELRVEEFAGIDIALFSAGASVSLKYSPEISKHGTVIIDNSSAFRMEKDVPLVVPEVNRDDIFKHKGIIANPNCSTIQMVVVLKPLHDAFRIKRVVVATYQSVAGAGQKGVNQLEDEIAGRPLREKKFAHPIAYNALPHIDVFFDDGYTKEEVKMMTETSKIMGENIHVTATTVRVPVIGGHSEAVNIEFEKPSSADEIREILQKSPGIVIEDDPKKNIYPLAINAQGKDDVFVGRIRKDNTVKSGVNLWIVSDSVRKGAATNAVQIAEALIAGKARNG